MPAPARRALVTGVTGYVGSRLAPALLRRGWRVRVLTRHPDRVARRDWGGPLEVVAGDASRPDDLARACAGVDVAYYLLHSMDGRDGFPRRDRELAWHFAHAVAEAGVGRVVYLSGLHPPDGPLSEHLASRVEVGQLLLGSEVPTAVLQAAVVVGAGSASFELLRHLGRLLPVVPSAGWLDTRVQPIAVGDLLAYLTGAADLPPGISRTFDVGGPEVLTYREMLARFAAVAGRPRPVTVPVPGLTPALAGPWAGRLTPVPEGLVRALVGSLPHEVVCRERDLDGLLPDPPAPPTPFDVAVRAALTDPGTPRPEPGRADPAVLHAGDPGWAGPRPAVEEPADQ
jgi:uncharacterized protein YbjT (DUF2867 family)